VHACGDCNAVRGRPLPPLPQERVAGFAARMRHSHVTVRRLLAGRRWLVLPVVACLTLVGVLALGISRQGPLRHESPTAGPTTPGSPTPAPTTVSRSQQYFAEVTFNALYGAAVPGVGSIPYPFVTYYVATRDRVQYNALLALDASGGVWEVNAVASIPPEWKVPLCTRGPLTTVWSTVDWGSKAAALQYCDGSFAPGTWPAPSDCKATWKNVASPPAPSDFVSGLALAALSPTDIWMAEQYGSSANGGTLMAHFDGSRWTTQPGPELGPRQWALNGFAPLATNDIWGVGFSSASSTATEALIEHYAGSSWVVVPGPAVNAVSSTLGGITRIPHRNELWAVGQASAGTTTNTLIEHYNGTTWTVVPSPNLGSSSTLSSVSGDAADDVWAVGQSSNGKLQQTLIEHYDGTRWRVVPSPNDGAAGNWLNGVLALSRTDAWAVGESVTGDGGMPKYALIEHYDGTSWTLARRFPLADSILFGLTATSSTDVWAVGNYQHTDAVYSHTLLEHFDGSSIWAVVPTPYIEMANASFASIVSIPQSGDLWLAGTFNNAVDTQAATFSRPLIQSLTWRC